jgi:hypothetical protein
MLEPDEWETFKSGLRGLGAAMAPGYSTIKDGPRRGDYHTSLVYPGGLKTIHPPVVADFIVHELSEDRFTGNVVGIRY